MYKRPVLIGLSVAALIGGCASGPQPPAYPAFVVSDEMSDMFIAVMPGVRAIQYASDQRTRSMSARVDFPEGWSGTTGGDASKALEMFVLSGEMQLADVRLTAGGYAYVPPGSLGFNMHTETGARVLYFLGDFNVDALIRTPLILDSALVKWQATDSIGVVAKELRADPGSGERTWLMRYEPGAVMPWQSSSAALEGYLVSGQFQDSECVAGKPYTDIYAPGGYFSRPAESVHGGPAAYAITESVWFLRQKRRAEINLDAECSASAAEQAANP